MLNGCNWCYCCCSFLFFPFFSFLFLTFRNVTSCHASSLRQSRWRDDVRCEGSHRRTASQRIHWEGCGRQGFVVVILAAVIAHPFHTLSDTTVLGDIISIMLDKSLVEQMFARQDVYQHVSLFSMFEKLANASVMRLNEESMAKVG